MTVNVVVVALCGRRRAGKDTVAEHLCRAHGFLHVKLSRQLKDGVACFFGFTPEQVDGDEKDEVDPRWGVAPRAALQWLGTDVMQHRIAELLGPGFLRRFWATQLAHSMAAVPGKSDEGCRRFVVSDVRFKHEVDVLRERFGKEAVMCVRITRARHADAQADADAHSSEVESDAVPCDVEVLNDGLVELLLARVERGLAGASPVFSLEGRQE